MIDEAMEQTQPTTMPLPPTQIIRGDGYQVVKLEPIAGFVVGGGTSAVALRGLPLNLPEGAVLVSPSASLTADARR